MSKGDKRPKRVEDDATANEPVDVQLPQELGRRNPTLIHAVYVCLQPAPDVLQDLVDNSDRERRMVPLQVVGEDRQERDLPVLDLPRLREHLVQGAQDDGIIPVKPPEKLEYLLDRLLCQDVVDKVTDEELHRRALFDLSSRPLRWIALSLK